MQLDSLPKTWTVKIKDKQMELSLTELRKLNDDTLRLLAQYDAKPNRLVRLVCLKRKISREDLFARCRKERNAIARWCVFWLMRKEMRSREIAKIFDVHDFTVDYGLRELKNRMESDPKFRKELAWLENGTV